jgi:hypothetical protein
MALKELKDEDILERGYRAIIDELGIAGFTRFIRLTQERGGNWTEEKESILRKFNSMTIEELVDYIKEHSRGPKEGQEVL